MPAWLLAALLVTTAAPAAQTPAPPTQAASQAAPPVRIFLDCHECDTDYIRREVTFVDYVRERAVADIHVLVTTQDTGGGGMAWTLKYIGLGRLAGVDRTQTFTTSLTATSDDRRREFARIFKLGLAGYAADTTAAPRLDVTWRRPPPAQLPSSPQKDPWRKWLFRTDLEARTFGEQSSKNVGYRVSVSGSRTTPEWKSNVSAGRNYDENQFQVSDTKDVTSINEGWNMSGLLVKSLTDKWSWGARGSLSSSSFSNTSRALSASTGPEFDFFPYAEIDRRSLTVQYTAGVAAYKYRELTIYDKLEETVPFHTVAVSLGLRQPWGSVGASTSVTQHLNHLDRFNASTFGNADVRLFKGFSFNFYAGYSKIEDQIALRKGQATEEEILLRLKQQATNYSFHYGIGFSYSFGSIFDSIVNPRFGGSSGFFFFF